MDAIAVLLLFVTLLQTVLSQQTQPDAIKVRYNITRETQAYCLYGVELGEVYVRSKLECMTMCSTSYGCRSVIFDPDEKTCIGNRWGINDSLVEDGCNVTRQVLYASKILKSTVGLDCRNSTDCVDTADSECNTTSKMCECKSDFGFNTTNHTCVAGDTVSGPTGGITRTRTQTDRVFSDDGRRRRRRG